MPTVHPTAVIDPSATLADGVEVGAYCIVEGDVSVAAGCVLRPHAVVRRYTTLGEGNFVDSFAVLGGWPQDLKFDPATVTGLVIGSGNTFREGVTISRASVEGKATVVGDRCYWMANSHAGHDVTVGSDVILANGAGIGGHSRVADRVFLSAHVMVHQFCWIGEGVMSQGQSGVSMHVPPWSLFADINCVNGMNSVGMKRNPKMTGDDRRQLKEAFTLVYRSGLATDSALARMEAHDEWGPFAAGFRQFVREVLAAEKPYARGLCPFRRQVFNKH